MRASRTPSGFFPDPLGDAWWRYWNGDRWTDDTCNDRFPPTSGHAQQHPISHLAHQVDRDQFAATAAHRVNVALVAVCVVVLLAGVAVPGNQIRLGVTVFAVVSACGLTAAFARSRRGDRTTLNHP
jgi:Protein of unknown function (DUF2510)